MNTKLNVLALLIGISSIAYGATPSSSFEIKRESNSKIVRLVYHSQTKGSVKINIFDESGAILLSKTVKNQPNFSLPVNFENQSSGKYVVTIADETGSQSKEVKFDHARTYSSLVTALKDDRYLVSLSNPAHDNISINVLDEDGNTVATQQTSDNTALLFNLSKVKGEPKFEISRY